MADKPDDSLVRDTRTVRPRHAFDLVGRHRCGKTVEPVLLGNPPRIDKGEDGVEDGEPGGVE